MTDCGHQPKGCLHPSDTPSCTDVFLERHVGDQATLTRDPCTLQSHSKDGLFHLQTGLFAGLGDRIPALPRTCWVTLAKSLHLFWPWVLRKVRGPRRVGTGALESGFLNSNLLSVALNSCVALGRLHNLSVP